MDNKPNEEQDVKYEEFNQKERLKIAILLSMGSFAFLICGLCLLLLDEEWVKALGLLTSITGAVIAFFGNNLVLDMATRFDAKETKEWKVGNKMQFGGFLITLMGICLSAGL